MYKIIIKKDNTPVRYKSFQFYGIHIYWQKLPTLERDEQHILQILHRSRQLDEGIFLAICGLNMCRKKEFVTGVVRLEIARDKIDKTIKYIYEHKMPRCKDNVKSSDLVCEKINKGYPWY